MWIYVKYVLAVGIQNQRTGLFLLKILLLVIRITCVQIIELGEDYKGEVNKWIYKKQNKTHFIKASRKVCWREEGRSMHKGDRQVPSALLERCWPGTPMPELWAVLDYWMLWPRWQMWGKVTVMHVNHFKLPGETIPIVKSKKHVHHWILEQKTKNRSVNTRYYIKNLTPKAVCRKHN